MDLRVKISENNIGDKNEAVIESQPHLNIIFLCFVNHFSFGSPSRNPLFYYLMCWLDRLQIHQIIFQGLSAG